MDGVLIIDKPAGPTSHDVVNRVRRVFATRKVGHTGTLDPFATGVMVVLVGKATRLAKFADRADKEYEAAVRFGVATDTGDLTGTRIGSAGRSDISSDEIESVLGRFRGRIMQVPPMYSAKKIDGKRLYELARRGEEIERPAVPVAIREIEVLPRRSEPNEIHRIRIRCSAGTYIRALAEDIAKALGTAAHLEELRRTASGRFSLEQSVALGGLAEDDEPSKYLLPLETLIEGLSRFVLNGDRVQKTLNGMSSRVYDATFDADETVAMFSEDNELVAIGKFVAGENAVQPTLVLGRT
ncbi:MAG TPA: tRNA pseudouridine(55) synthase TruB [Pyrinomonadaceae bacterium]|nr:tRNA pseudouridine(55) synthase TruB [Pyrinomonadaceae bacterium]